MSDAVLVSIGVGIAIFFAVFLILRELMCWYYKINERVALQKETNRLLKIMILNQGGDVTAKEYTCKSCGFISNKNSEHCPKCGKNDKGKLKTEIGN